MLYPSHHRKKIRKLGSCDGRVVKALDLKSNGIFPRRFEPYSQRYFAMGSYFLTKSQPEFVVAKFVSCDGRVVKAFDSKSNGIFPRRFESYSQRWVVLYTSTFLIFWILFHCKIDHDGDRTHNLPIRSRTPYPLGHAAGAPFSIFLIDIWLMQFCTTMNAKVVLVVSFVGLSF